MLKSVNKCCNTKSHLILPISEMLKELNQLQEKLPTINDAQTEVAKLIRMTKLLTKAKT